MASSSWRAAASTQAAAPAATSSSGVDGCGPAGPRTVIVRRAECRDRWPTLTCVVAHLVAVDLALERRQGDAGRARRGGPTRPLGHAPAPARARRTQLRGATGVDEPPVDGLLALDALGPGGEHVGEVAADVALVDEPGEPTGPGQHGQQRHLRQRHGRGPIVDEEDLVARQGQLVATACGGAVDGGDPRLPGVGAGVLDGVARLVGELAEVDLVAVRRARQHLDVGAGAERSCRDADR